MTGKGFNESADYPKNRSGLRATDDCGVQAVVKIYERIIGPKPFSEFFTSDDFAAPFQQYCENPARLPLKLDLSALFPKLTRAYIDLVDTEANELRRNGGLFARFQGQQWHEYTPGAACRSKSGPQVI